MSRDGGPLNVLAALAALTWVVLGGAGSAARRPSGPSVQRPDGFDPGLRRANAIDTARRTASIETLLAAATMFCSRSRGVRGAAAVAMTGLEGRTSDVEQIA